MKMTKPTWAIGLAVLTIALSSPGCSNNDYGTNPPGGSQTKFNSGTLNPGDSFVFTFSIAESVPYHCNFHPMQGTVTVNAATGATDTVSISITSSSFPAFPTTMNVGRSVRWTNNHVGVAHTVTSDSQ
jgi:plastocyanin